MPRPEVVHPYCLRCFAELHDMRGQAVRCPRCGYQNLAHDRRTYWNRHPRLMRVEQEIRTAGALVSAGIAVALVIAFPISSGAYAGFLFALPIALGTMAWKSAGKMTRHLPGTHPAGEWGGLLLATGLASVVFAAMGWIGPVAGSVLAVLSFGGVVAIAWGSLHAMRWKARLMRGLPDRASHDRPET
jgi:DNA-directed RNA polymerase subunit RPC12/RpoP